MLMKNITLKDCYELERKFKKYCSRANPKEFMFLFIIDTKMQDSIQHYKVSGIQDQDDANAMFRVVLKAIKEDYTDYEKDK